MRLMPEGQKERVLATHISRTFSNEATTRFRGHLAADDLHPGWSPDGSKIAFSRPDAAGRFDIWTMGAADGSSAANLTESLGDDAIYAAWSPDASEIAFTKVTGFFQLSVWKMAADGSNPVLLSSQASLLPSYSPDGSKITFTSFRDGDDEVYVMASDGSSQTRLTNSTGTDAASRYSLDGAKIVFVSNRHNPVDPNLDLDVYSMNTDGTSQARITMGASITTPPSIGSGAAPPGSGMALADVPISFFRASDGQPVGLPGLTDAEGRYEKWLPPSAYSALFNTATPSKPLGWNGYSPACIGHDVFCELGNTVSVADPSTSVELDEALLPLRSVSGRVVPQGGPGLSGLGFVTAHRYSDGKVFASIAAPADGEFTFPLPDGEWYLVFHEIPGYQDSYYRDTQNFASRTKIGVSGAPITLEDQHVQPN